MTNELQGRLNYCLNMKYPTLKEMKQIIFGLDKQPGLEKQG